MGTHEVSGQLKGGQLRAFTKQLLNDLHALDRMLCDGKLDAEERRIGAEQELFLIDSNRHPAPLADEVLERIADPSFTTELARFNLEFNLEPERFGGHCLRHLEESLRRSIETVRETASSLGADVVLAGILPTLSKSDLGLENMTPRPRYAALNEAMSRLRGSDYHFSIRGIDELSFRHSSVMLEACNTSFQIHFQVGAREFPRLYNLAQTVTAPVLAASTNSPLLFGKRLWRETRIALFQQSVDTRTTPEHLRETSPRVSFGDRWVQESVLEIYREDVTRFRVLIGAPCEENSLAIYEAGEIPKLRALQLHNSTVYRWNRPCYGVCEGRPCLRIENRALPAGPSVADEVANAAFWYGLLAGLSRKYPDITAVIDFDEVKCNFVAAARLGLDAHLIWMDGNRLPAQQLICRELLPVAQEGLEASGIDADDIRRYLGIIEARVTSGRTGSQWLLDSLTTMKDMGTKAERLAALTAASLHNQLSGEPVSRWEPAQLEDAGGWKSNFMRVEQYMTTDLFTVHEDEILDLVAGMMHWKHIRHVPVEDSSHRLVGLISYRTILHFLSSGMAEGRTEPVAVSEVMEKSIVTIPPNTSTLEAMHLMRENRISCLPVVEDGRLVGMVTERDFVEVSRLLLEEFLEE